MVLAEHPTIGVISLFGTRSGSVGETGRSCTRIPPVFLGRAKSKWSTTSTKGAHADAQMNKADWMTVAAAIVGIIGIGFGLWWADVAAAIFISVDIIHDGWSNVRAAVHDLMDARPRRHDAREYHPVVDQMQRLAEDCDWVEEAAVRLREEGHVFTGEVMANNGETKNARKAYACRSQSASAVAVCSGSATYRVQRSAISSSNAAPSTGSDHGSTSRRRTSVPCTF